MKQVLCQEVLAEEQPRFDRGNSWFMTCYTFKTSTEQSRAITTLVRTKLCSKTFLSLNEFAILVKPQTA